MAFQMIHMEIAYRLLERLDMIENPAEFVLGSVAPDAVHMRHDYDISMKVHSHLFEGCGPWSDTQDYQRWRSNIQSFFSKISYESSKERDFAIGICVHCLTDYWNDLRIWRRLQSQYIPPMSVEEFREAYYPEAKNGDVWLYQNSKNTDAIRKLLEKAELIEIEGIVQKEYLEKQRSHLLYTQYQVEMIDISEHCYLKDTDVYEFIDFAVNDIADTILEFMNRNSKDEYEEKKF